MSRLCSEGSCWGFYQGCCLGGLGDRSGCDVAFSERSSLLVLAQVLLLHSKLEVSPTLCKSCANLYPEKIVTLGNPLHDMQHFLAGHVFPLWIVESVPEQGRRDGDG